jgi:hypothetical protein
MSSLRFLCDEGAPLALTLALRTEATTADVLRVGDPGAPPAGTKDPALLMAAESLGRVFISMDRRTMPGHLIAHFQNGHHTAGVILLRNGFPLERYIREIVSQATTFTPDTWTDRTIYLP